MTDSRVFATVRAMPTICYQPKAFTRAHQSVIAHANRIIEEYQAQGFTLTLRQLYYQFVARDLVPNQQKQYKRLGGIINDGRLAGEIDWYAIEDRTRELRGLQHWGDPAQIVDAAANSYRVDKWAEQPARVEVWIEKDALLGVIERVCNELDVSYFSCRGYTSQSELWRAGMRMKRYRDAGQEPYVLHLGDHDPSGMDMTRDILDRLQLFMGGMEVNRLALNMDQVRKYEPPPNPAKMTDSRFESYVREYGDESWELDALEPSVMAKLIKTAVLKVRDAKKWRASVQREDEQRDRLAEAAEELKESMADADETGDEDDYDEENDDE